MKKIRCNPKKNSFLDPPEPEFWLDCQGFWDKNLNHKLSWSLTIVTILQSVVLGGDVIQLERIGECRLHLYKQNKSAGIFKQSMGARNRVGIGL